MKRLFLALLVGVLLAAATLVFGSGLWEKYQLRQLRFDLRPLPSPIGKATLTIFNRSNIIRIARAIASSLQTPNAATCARSLDCLRIDF